MVKISDTGQFIIKPSFTAYSLDSYTATNKSSRRATATLTLDDSRNKVTLYVKGSDGLYKKIIPMLVVTAGTYTSWYADVNCSTLTADTYTLEWFCHNGNSTDDEGGGQFKTGSYASSTQTFIITTPSASTSIRDVRDILQEIIVVLRNNITDPNTRGTLGTYSFTGTSATEYTLNALKIKRVSSVTVSGSTQTFGSDYTIDYKDTDNTAYPIITFTVAPNGLAVVITYYYGETWVFSDYARDEMSLTKYPRISVDLADTRSRPGDIGGTSNKNDYIIRVFAYGEKISQVNQLIYEIKNYMVNHKKSFYYLPFIDFNGAGPLIKQDVGLKNKILLRSLDFISKDVYESI